MKYRTIRILPWYAGSALRPAIVTKIKLCASSILRVPDAAEVGNEPAEIVLYGALPRNDYLYVHVYGSGIILFSVLEHVSEQTEVADFNPDDLQAQKRLSHRLLLAGDHAASDLIARFMAIVEQQVRSHVARRDIDYECDLAKDSYVFSFSKFSARTREEMNTLVRAADALLFPVHASRTSKGSDASIWDVSRPRSDFMWDMAEVTQSKNAIAIGLNRVLLASWATAIEIQVDETCDFAELWRFERLLQRLWFHLYIFEQIVEGLLSRRDPARRWHQRHYDQLVNLKLELFAMDGFGRGNVSESQHRLLELLRETSGITRKALRMNEIIENVLIAHQWRSHRAAFRKDIYVSMFLTLITALNVLFAYKAVQANAYSTLELLAFGGACTVAMGIHIFYLGRDNTED